MRAIKDNWIIEGTPQEIKELFESTEEKPPVRTEQTRLSTAIKPPVEHQRKRKYSPRTQKYKHLTGKQREDGYKQMLVYMNESRMYKGEAAKKVFGGIPSWLWKEFNQWALRTGADLSKYRARMYDEHRRRGMLTISKHIGGKFWETK